VTSLILSYLGVSVTYVISGIMIVGGLYLGVVFSIPATNPLAWVLRPLRFVGFGIFAIGLFLAAYTTGKARGIATGAAEVTAEWQAKNLEAAAARAKQEAEAQKIAAQESQAAAKRLAEFNDALQQQVTSYEEAAKGYAACRRSTDDDDRRMCKLSGNSAIGCKNTK
jgi:hypothetical protein